MTDSSRNRPRENHTGNRAAARSAKLRMQRVFLISWCAIPLLKILRRISDPDEIQRAIDSGEEHYRTYTKDPNVHALTDLMNRALDKPAQQTIVTGTNDGPINISWLDHPDESIAVSFSSRVRPALHIKSTRLSLDVQSLPSWRRWRKNSLTRVNFEDRSIEDLLVAISSFERTHLHPVWDHEISWDPLGTCSSCGPPPLLFANPYSTSIRSSGSTEAGGLSLDGGALISYAGAQAVP